MLEVPTARDIGIIRDAQNGPIVAFSDLCLPTGSRDYINALEFERDFGRKSALAREPRIKDSLRLHGKYTELNFNVDGWHAHPDDSRLARQRFMWLAKPFFPAHPDRGQMLQTLAYRFAEIASALDRKRLTFAFRAISTSVENYVHFDPAGYTAIAYLRGDATQHVQEADSLLSEMPSWEHDKDSVNHILPHKHYARLTGPPKQSIAAWRGLNAGRASLHGRIGLVEKMRLVCIAATHEDDKGCAYKTAPSSRRKIKDLQNSRHY